MSLPKLKQTFKMISLERYLNREKGKGFQSKLKYFSNYRKSKSFETGVITYGVGGNTFRAFVGFDKQPSIIYRTWAERKFNELTTGILELKIEDQAAFDVWHKKLFNSLSAHWYSEQGREISLAHSYKLLDLFLKWVYQHKSCPEDLANSIEQFGHCALDSQVLKELNICFSFALPINNPTMGDIINQNTYDFCQNLIEYFTHEFGGTKLAFDFYAWKGKTSE